MLSNKLQRFFEVVQIVRSEVGNSAPRIADRVISEAFPDTSSAAEREGATKMLRDGVIAYLTKHLKHPVASDSQADFAEIADDYLPIVKKLSSPSHYVPSLEEHLPVSRLISRPELLDEARRFKRAKGLETLAEADVLDELYEAVVGGV